MPTDQAASWDRLSAEYQEAAQLPTDVAVYGPDIPTEADLRLLGDVKGKRILDLGCGAAQAAISFAKAGATAIGVDFSAEQLARGRALCEREEVRVELRQGDLADLAFLRADSIDGAFAANAFDYVEDLSRVFRQVHRVLKVGAPLAFSVMHPFWAISAGMRAGRSPSYFDRSPVVEHHGGTELTVFPRTFSDLYTALMRASYRVDAFIEPEPVPHAPRSLAWDPAMASMPLTLVVRARKEGS
ncbi:class I SAM-dependent methyltransferase [Acidiferrimicrobium sp. IK]|uniref:class I SAM-dependent methyltransferase n=1 Tax=Acidiferrimicrobium sp. IK TaxID=2871700 RepID=UPI0021CB01B0|nr:class I SAM-dependent methyltransferase [Acidiferrimicrobium sp. IK]MCU4187127.1 class I SAM-dependent methyltransferase [Acidiferrimicrobium sp. IK]